MVILEKGNFRLATISRATEVTREGIKFETCEVKEGIALEKRSKKDYEGKPCYYVVAFVKFDKHEGCSEIDAVGMRILDIESEEWELAKSLLKAAEGLINAANEEE